jgi:hypothetical protein
MSNEMHSDPAEQTFLRWFYRSSRPTRLGHWVNRMEGWLLGLGFSKDMAILEVRGRSSGQRRATPVVVAVVEGKRCASRRAAATTSRSPWARR